MVKDLVLDASATIEAILGRLDIPVHAGFHSHAGLDIEVASTLRKHVLHKSLSAHSARDGIDVMLAMEIARHPLRRLIPRVWNMRHDISAYDAGYVALAEALGIPLLTLDRKLAKTAQRYCDVIVP